MIHEQITFFNFEATHSLHFHNMRHSRRIKGKKLQYMCLQKTEDANKNDHKEWHFPCIIT